MPDFLDKVFLKFKHVAPSKKQNSLHPHTIPQYGAKTKYSESQDKSPLLNKEDTKHVQAVMGPLLCYIRAVDSTVLTALSSLATEQAKPMQKMMEKAKQLLDYCVSQEEAIITYNKSKLILVVHSDAGYWDEKKLHSRAGGHFFLSNKDKFPPNNGAIFTNATLCWPFWWPWWCIGMIPHALPNGGGQGLHQKPLDATIGQVLCPKT
jgi:hypothetical protein